MNEPKQLEKIGRYQILARVGKGGMGVLYRGFDPVLDREVAIKLMLADFSEDAEQMRPRFYREARAAAKLQHRNIVTIFEFAEESNVPYIVMEFLRGTPLGARINTQPPLTIDDKLNIVAQLCEGLWLRARARRRASRRQARQRLPARRRLGQTARLRHRQAHQLDADAAGRRARQRVVHVARAGRRWRVGGWPRRHLLRRASCSTRCWPDASRSWRIRRQRSSSRS